MTSYLGAGIDRERIKALFHAAAVLWHAAPWDVILSDECLIRISSDSLGLRDAVVSVVGQHRTMFGFILFPGGVDDFATFVRNAGSVQRGMRPRAPSHLSLNYLEGRELPASSRREIAARHWEIAAPGAYPMPAAVDGDPLGRMATPDELVTIECVALALADLVAKEPQLSDATFGVGSFERAIVVDAHGGSVTLSASAPCVPPPDPDEDDLMWIGESREPAAAQAMAAPPVDPEDARKARNRAKAARRSRR